jgi:hypothetical protein
MQVFQVFSYIHCKCFYLDIAIFVMTTHVFSSFLWCLQVFQMYVAGVLVVSDVCYKCFI